MLFTVRVTLQRVLHALTHCMLLTTPRGKYCLTGWETRRLGSVPKSAQTVSGGAGIQTQVLEFKSNFKIHVLNHCGFLLHLVELGSERWSGGILALEFVKLQ